MHEEKLKEDAAPLSEERTDTIIHNGHIKFCVVGIGASAGGLEALEKFFKNMPVDSGLSFVIVQHLSPDYKSLMDEILAKYTDMTIMQVEDGTEILQNHIYLIPRKKNMTVFHGKLYLTEQSHNFSNLNLPIDIFFKSLAEDYREKAIAVILSGTGSDGTRGIRAIKEAGGTVIIQEPNSAKFDGMPKSALSTGIVDCILPVEKIPEILINLSRHPSRTINEMHDSKIINKDDVISKILSIIKYKTGTDFTHYKMNTVIRRIEHRMGINQIEDIYTYLRHLHQSDDEVKTLCREILIGITQFFRDPAAFKLIEETVIPGILKNKATGEPVRVWIAGCSTGEEAYSIGILFKEYCIEHGLSNEIKIFATDIDKNALEQASLGVYSESAAGDITRERLNKFFIKKNESYMISPEIREMVIFAPHNLIKDPPFSKIDLVVCRNLLIYFQPVLQKKVFASFSFSLIKNGYLFIGPSETLGDFSEHFTACNTKWKIYQFASGQVKERDSSNIGSGTFNLEVVNKKYGINFKKEYDENLTAFLKDTELNEKLFNNILETCAITCVVINKANELLHLFGNIEKYLKLQSGKMNLGLFSMVDKSLKIPLSSLIHKAFDKQQANELNGITLEDHIVNLKIIPFTNEHTKEPLAVIIFEENRELKETAKIIDKVEVDSISKERIDALEKELHYTKQSLKATVEELETSNEELQATNEELIASNEELQSTNEELQSVNEELITVNSEYQSKIGELTELNNDMNSIFSSADIGAVFIDKNLCIRKFTSGIKKQINLLEHDIGRPLKDISINIRYKRLLDDALDVLNNLESKEVEVEGNDGTWFLLKVQPYKTMDKFVRGVVIIFVDITRIKKMELQIKNGIEEREKYSLDSKALHNIHDAVISVDLDFNIIQWNYGAEIIYGWKSSEVLGKPAPEIMRSEPLGTDAESARKEIISQGYWQGEVIQRRKDSSKVVILSLVTTIYDENDKATGYLVVNRDISSYKLLGDMTATSANKVFEYFEYSDDLVIVVSDQGKIRYINKTACAILDCDTESIKDQDWFETLISEQVKPAFREAFEKTTSLKVPYTENLVYELNEGKYKGNRLSWNIKALCDSDGKIEGVLAEGKLIK